MTDDKGQVRLGTAGSLARLFIRSKITPLIVAASLLLGAFALRGLPREEEPQIDVPIFDVFVPFPGAGAREVQERIVNVGERKFREIPDVEYVYSTAEAGMALFIVRFKVGTDPEEAMTRIYTKASAHSDLLAMGALRPLIKPRSIDDVPILSVTLRGASADAAALRRAAARLRDEISSVEDVSDAEVIGGRLRRFHVFLDPARLAAHRIAPLELAGLLQSVNIRLPAGRLSSAKATLVEADAQLRTLEDLAGVIVGISDGEPVKLSDVARVEDGPDESEREVLRLEGPYGAPVPAVTIAVSKRRGANATSVARKALEIVSRREDELAARDIRISITRNYGETAKEKSDELIFHMLLATVSVTLLIALALGPREALVVLIAIPVTLSLTLLIYYLSGYTLNRITLFALIFSIGILVDDAIVVVENIHRHYMMQDARSLWKLSVDAVDEVGNPTLLATWTVVAAILPMAFVSGLMGPYMRPIPVGASVAMVFSLLIAFAVSPWAFAHLLELWKPKESGHAAQEGRLDKAYRRLMAAILDDRRIRGGYFAGVALLLLASLSLVLNRSVIVKMLPFDNKDEFEIILNMPEDAAIETTRAAALEIAERARMEPEVREVVAYVGAAAPYNFNGLVRHYFLRQRPHQADITVHLAGRHDRKRQSHAVAQSLRAPVKEIASRYGARAQVAEVPPGPPVLSTLVLEIYGPDAGRRIELAGEIRGLLEKTDGIVDVDTYSPEPPPKERLLVDAKKATLNGIPASEIVQTLALALEGRTVGLAHADGEPEPLEIRMRLPRDKRRATDAARSIRLNARNGTPIPISSLVRPLSERQDDAIHHKNMRPVTYVIADVAGKQESPVYAILDIRKKVLALAGSGGYRAREYFTREPGDPSETAIKWDGEWQITYEVFRDMGIAFALVLVLIYVLVVAWFKSFGVPLVIMTPIPLTLVGILPAHWGMGAFFTATSMIGFIAGAGIVVRNSIILVDFIQLRLREGMPLREAVIDAGAVRFRPMLLTAAAVVVGAGVILFDPIFQGLAISLIAGEVASTLLSRTSVPILYYLYARRLPGKEAA